MISAGLAIGSTTDQKVRNVLGAVDPGRLLHDDRDRLEELLHDEHAGGVHQQRHERAPA